MGSMQSEEMTPQIQVYDFEYKQLHVLNLTGLEENMIYGMALCHNEKWLVVTHQCGFISVVNTEDMTFKSVEPLGYLDNIWGCCIVEQPDKEIEKLAFYTSQGLHTASLTMQGELQKSDEVFFVDHNVTNAEIVKGDMLLCTMNDTEEISKLMTIDVCEKKTELVIDWEETVYSYDLKKIPGTGEDPYFILHQGNGLYLIDPINKKNYNLRYDDSANYTTCRSVAMNLVNEEDEERGFWLANIDNSNQFSPEIKVFDFDSRFISELQKISQQVNEGKH